MKNEGENPVLGHWTKQNWGYKLKSGAASWPWDVINFGIYGEAELKTTYVVIHSTQNLILTTSIKTVSHGTGNTQASE